MLLCGGRHFKGLQGHIVHVEEQSPARCNALALVINHPRKRRHLLEICILTVCCDSYRRAACDEHDDRQGSTTNQVRCCRYSANKGPVILSGPHFTELEPMLSGNSHSSQPQGRRSAKAGFVIALQQ